MNTGNQRLYDSFPQPLLAQLQPGDLGALRLAIAQPGHTGRLPFPSPYSTFRCPLCSSRAILSRHSTSLPLDLLYLRLVHPLEESPSMQP